MGTYANRKKPLKKLADATIDQQITVLNSNLVFMKRLSWKMLDTKQRLIDLKKEKARRRRMKGKSHVVRSIRTHHRKNHRSNRSRNSAVDQTVEGNCRVAV